MAAEELLNIPAAQCPAGAAHVQGMSTNEHQLHWTIPPGLAVPTADSTFEAGAVTVTWSPEDDQITVTVSPRDGGTPAVFKAVNGFWSPDYPDWAWKLSHLSYFVATGRSMPEPPPGFALVRHDAPGAAA